MTTTPLTDTWLIQDVLRPEGLTWMSGPIGEAKSLLTLDVACHVASGRNWHGQPVDGCRVLHVTGVELGTIQQRLRAWKQHYGVGAIDDLLISAQYVKVESPYWDMFVQSCRKLELDLIILDGPMWAWEWEWDKRNGVNKSDPMAKTLNGLDALAQTTGATVLLAADGLRDFTGPELAMSTSGDVVSMRPMDRIGAAPFRFKMTDVAIGKDARGLSITSQILTPAK
ncbi:AAA family ATPase [Catellatospora bangladeshensis]|uniref:Uncharacterized protein n=1 Tax=Catellatospora bangladeshensis TaxID=310355 RepID=A0A8J3JRM3_9ACTN|nr:AAA family ATPase [Catellatospora bangladeshensis]GIF83865.1 hypothetical protein Cba03nite_52140 [Catellatospora bangladeshensis]